LSVFYRKTDGFFHNSYLNCDDCNDYYKEYGVAPRVVFKLGENGTIDFKTKYSKITAGAINFNAAFALPQFAGFLNVPEFFENVNNHEFKYINNVVPRNEQENKQISVKGDWHFDIGNLTAWAAYNDQTNFFLTDGASAAFGLYGRTPWCQADIAAQVGAPLPKPTFYAGASSVLPPYSPSRCDGYQYQQRDQRDASAEVRLASPSQQALRWLGGVYYADIRRHVVVSQGADTGTGLLTQAFVPSSGPNPTDLLYDDNFHSKVSAVFGQLAYDVMPNLEAAVALRYDSEKRDVDNAVPTGAGALAQTPLFGYGPGVPYINPAYTTDPALATNGIPSRSATFNQLQPKGSLNWKLDPAWSAYASYGYGFRSGGFNSTGSNATIVQYLGNLKYVQPDGTVSSTPSIVTQGIDYDRYKKELSKATEFGIKGDLFDHALTVDLAAYRTIVENMQTFNFLVGPFGLLRVVTNIDEATLKGVEGDARWRASRYLSLFGGFSLVESKINSFASRPYTQGNRVPYAPEFTTNVGFQLKAPVADTGLAAFLRMDLNTIGRTWFSAVQDNKVQTQFNLAPGLPAIGDYSRTARASFSLLNARLGVSGDRWSVTAWSRNLTNRQYLEEVIPAPEFGGSFVHSGTGRAVGLEVSYALGQ
jgi:iron complex outermembrane receptor protein